MRTFHTFVLLSLLTVATFAQGPDVIVGSLNGTNSYGSSGGIYAYSVGTTSCNIGNVWLNWISNTNQHPVIGQAFYRLKGGRFEQIGFSWLKHGFFALSGSLCFTDCQSTDGSHLGVHCSDPYDPGLNGDAFGLGPRNEVNASTGYFPYPVAGSYPSPAGSTIARRIQCPAADVNPALNAGALYWAEGHYVSPDDATAGNKNNNASYRAVTFAPTTFSATLSGSTVQQQPAIAAWQAADPAVVLTNVDFPNDGRFIIGRKVTNLGGGNFHFEFAVHNLSSDASGRGFTVDFPAGTVVSNAGYRSAPAYHSGEPYVNTAWVNTINGNSINWAGQTFIQNPNANAIRFGTTHNFWCDATAGAETNRTIELFKPYCALADPVVPTGVTYTMNTAAPLDNPALTAPVNGPTGDDATALVNIGFTFNFYGTNYTQVSVDTNGYLTFANDPVEWGNSCLPSAGAPNAMIAAYWDDLVVGAGECQYQTLGIAPNRRFVASWTNVNLFNTALNQTFKVILDETTNKITTTIVASAAGGSSGGAGATRGIENQFGNVALQASCNLAGSAVANTSQTFTPLPNILPSADLILSGSTGPFGVLGWTINSNALGAPILMIVSSDPGPIDLGPTIGVLNIGLPPGGFFVLGDGAGILQPPNPLDFTDSCGDWSIFIPLGAGGLPPGFTLYNQAIVITSTSVPPPPNGGFHITDMEILTT